ncbi:MAG: aminopeptidase P family protein [Acidobacteria bacterium]|nr:aminopeptidase P family protein [Acidobacteriota bacterium]
MFDPAIYRERRNRLKKDVGSGLILLLGNDEVGMNYAANTYHFRQDSTFLYFFAVNQPGLAAVIDVDAGTETLFGDDLTVADIVWTGPQPTIADYCKPAAIAASASAAALDACIATAISQGRRIHFLKPYRTEHTLKLVSLLGIKPTMVATYRSEVLHKAVVAQRNIKSAAEVADIERAINVSREMYLAAMAAAKPGKHEYEVVAEILRIAKARDCDLSFPIICSVHGETLHNHQHANLMKSGDVMVLDSGVETVNKYASDITRTIPVSGTFTPQQRAIYEMVLRAQMLAIGAVKPGVPYKDVHLMVARSFATDLKAVGLMKGDADEAVAAGAHAMFFPHGLGHMLGLDVHDAENIGEQYVGYEPGEERSTQFGLGYLRLARKLEPGFVLTVEPGLYFIPALIDQWKAERHLEQFINYAEVEKYRDARGYRVEDNVLVTQSGHTVLGAAIPKTVADVEQACKG